MLCKAHSQLLWRCLTPQDTFAAQSLSAFKDSALAQEWPPVDFSAFQQAEHVARVSAVQAAVRCRPRGTPLTVRKASPTHQIGVREYVVCGVCCTGRTLAGKPCCSAHVWADMLVCWEGGREGGGRERLGVQALFAGGILWRNRKCCAAASPAMMASMRHHGSL